jgi:hypothetical protein
LHQRLARVVLLVAGPAQPARQVVAEVLLLVRGKRLQRPLEVAGAELEAAVDGRHGGGDVGGQCVQSLDRFGLAPPSGEQGLAVVDLQLLERRREPVRGGDLRQDLRGHVRDVQRTVERPAHRGQQVGLLLGEELAGAFARAQQLPVPDPQGGRIEPVLLQERLDHGGRRRTLLRRAGGAEHEQKHRQAPGHGAHPTRAGEASPLR